jgi:DNA helicase-2/ATP-dependent DNA helicase PcrA
MFETTLKRLERNLRSLISTSSGPRGDSVPAEEVDLNHEQLAVVEAAVDGRLLVVAGAGQGKTEVVASRIDYLVKSEDLSASRESLVLSFSRAAVTAVRLRLHDRDVPAANVRTFDSFAGQLLLDAGIEAAGTFESRIRQATRLLRDGGEVPPAVEDLRHIVIDEIQDLVGDRADFVLALLQLVEPEVGLTGLGDPLQGIYDFQLEESQSKTSSQAVFTALTGTLGCEQVSLGRNYRARGKDPKRVVSLGEKLRKTTSLDEAQGLLEDLESDLLPLGEIDEWADEVTQENKLTAVLCATNGEVLRVSRYFNEQDIRHAVRRQAQDFGAAKWMAEAMSLLRGPRERRSEVEAALALALGVNDIEKHWYLLKGAEGRSSQYDSLDLPRLARLVKARTVPLTLTEPDHANVIVSTVHRAKGLEFDRVFIVEPGYVRDDEDEWATVRRQYVALSRARDEIFTCDLPRTYNVFKQERWLPGRLLERARKRNGKYRTKAMEFKYDDVEVADPGFSQAIAAKDVQQTLRQANMIGVRVVASLDLGSTTYEMPSYDLYTEDDDVVGRTSEIFGRAFKEAFGLRYGEYPTTINGLSLVSVETVAGDHRAAERVGLGPTEFWLAPRIVGLAQPDWSVTEEFE